jgi:hypothetical protein
MVLKEALGFFTVTELKKIKEYDFNEIYKEVKKCEFYGCNYCHKNKMKFIVSIFDDETTRLSDEIMRCFCSKECINEYFKDKKSVKRKLYPLGNLKKRLIYFLATYAPNKRNDLKKMILKEIEDRTKIFIKCNVCKGNANKGMDIIINGKNSGKCKSFCSWNCLKKYTDKNIEGNKNGSNN